MRRDRLLRSTPLRLALIFALMFVGAFLVAGAVVYELMSRELRLHQEQTIEESYAVIADAFGDEDATDLIETVRTNVRATHHSERLFLVEGPDGKKLAGNIRPISLPDGWSTVGGRAVGFRNNQRYRVFTGKVEGNRLTVGLSYKEIDSLQTIVLVSFGWASLAVLVLAVAGGVVIGGRAQRRLDTVAATMERVAQGDLTARIPTSRNRDDVDLLAGDINLALARLATAVEGIRQVSTDIAHDLKTPLNRLKITIEDALDRHGRGQPMVQSLEMAAAEADQINQTFEALLRIAQVEQGARKARFAPVDLREVLASLADVYEDVTEDAGQRLVCALGPAVPCMVLGDRELLTQMYVNLIENAIRHCPPGTTVTLGISRAANRCVTRVVDDGPGIPDSERDRVFRRLYRLEKSRTSPGTGLGLSLVKAVADLHDAAIAIDDAKPGLSIAVSFVPAAA